MITKFKRELMELKLAQISKTDGNLVVIEEDADNPTLRYLADKGAEKCNIFVALGKNNGGYNFVCCSKKSDLKARRPEIKSKVGLVGGGSSSMLQGKITAETIDVNNFFKI